jgi:hypothetical protein
MMRRRHFLGAMAGTMASPLLLRRDSAQAGSGTRAAVVIGVNKAGDLPALNAAASGARAVERWLRSEGFDVRAFVDDVGPVQAHMLHEAITTIVNAGTFEQLVVYFAGHGFLNAGHSEMWLLSEAPENSSEAVNLEECVYASRESGLKNVVFISDACRSTPDSLRSSRLYGYVIFPNLSGTRPLRPDVDRFLATLPGKESDEVRVTETAPRFDGIYTSALIDAFKKPQGDMVRTVEGVKVIPNRMLKSYLSREVPRRAQELALRLNQKPETIIESDEDTYIARVAPDAVVAPSTPTTSSDVTTFRDVAGLALKNVGLNILAKGEELSAHEINLSAEKTIFGTTQAQVFNANAPASFETGCGLNIVGTEVEFVANGPRLKAERLRRLDAGELVRIYPFEQRAGSLAIGFVGGGGTVVAALRNFVATVVVDQGRVVNVTYVPSGLREDDWIRALRATVAASAKFGVFRIEGDRRTRTAKAKELADQVRVGKAFDPTLGLYAAYAYADADILDQVESVRQYMRGNLGVDLFDVAMLSGGFSKSFPRENAVPFCPMLSQGWNLLRVKGVELPAEVQRTRDHIRAALWTTFDTEGINMLAAALSQGRLG